MLSNLTPLRLFYGLKEAEERKNHIYIKVPPHFHFSHFFDIMLSYYYSENIAMAIPESQLETWSHQGANTLSSTAYNSVRHALTKTTSPLINRDPDIFLQGSYANSTHIYADSDIDIVVLYNDTFFKDMSRLTPEQQKLHEIIFPPATYKWSHLRDDVLTALRSHLGSAAVKQGKKAIKVTMGTRMTADVVPAVQFRKYATFIDKNNLTAHWGICFYDTSGKPIINYPKYHIENGENKNKTERTRGKYKPMIRIFKNFRNWLVENNVLAEDTAPSYFLEGTLYNVPDVLFIGNISDSMPKIIDYLLTTPSETFLCQNGVVQLIGNDSTQWPKDNFVQFINVAKDAWDTWDNW